MNNIKKFEIFKSYFRNLNESYDISMSFCKSIMKFYFIQLFVAITELELEVILGNNSAHSLAIDPVIVDPFILHLGLKWLQHLSKTPTPYPSSFLFQFEIYPYLFGFNLYYGTAYHSFRFLLNLSSFSV